MADPTPPFSTPDSEPPVSPAAIPPPTFQEGLIGQWMKKVFGSSWKTGALGLLALLSATIPLIPDVNPKWAQVVLAVVTGLGLMFSKDGNVTGGNKLNDDHHP